MDDAEHKQTEYLFDLHKIACRPFAAWSLLQGMRQSFVHLDKLKLRQDGNSDGLDDLSLMVQREVVTSLYILFEQASKRWNLAIAIKGKQLRVSEDCKRRFESHGIPFERVKPWRNQLTAHNQLGASARQLSLEFNTTDNDIEELLSIISDCMDMLYVSHYGSGCDYRFAPNDNVGFGRRLVAGLNSAQ
jgi:hypothetical protein